jgi:hypothetical protein
MANRGESGSTVDWLKVGKGYVTFSLSFQLSFVSKRVGITRVP